MECENMNLLDDEAAFVRADREGLLTGEEISQKLKVKQSFLYSPARRKGDDPIPVVKVGKYLRYRLSDVLAWIERQNRG